MPNRYRELDILKNAFSYMISLHFHDSIKIKTEYGSHHVDEKTEFPKS